jgi:hypothetical protein
MEPEIALVAASVETDVDGAGLNLLNPATSKRSSQRTRDTAVVVYGEPVQFGIYGTFIRSALLSRGREEAGAINR